MFESADLDHAVSLQALQDHAEDWRNRRKWNYEFVEANNKRFARVKVLKTLCEAVEKAFS